MNCRACKNTFDDLMAGKLSPADRSRVDEHLAACSECAERFAAAGADRARLSRGEASKLTRGILERTSGAACERAHELLIEQLDGELDALSTDLLGSHTEHCSGCAELADAMTWANALLPEMAEIEPDADFMRDVIAVTSGATAAPSLIERLSERWRGMLLRPRFALEGAYIGTLMLIALFATPLSPARNAPARALETLRGSPEVIAASVAPDLAGLKVSAATQGRAVWGWSGAPLARTAHHLGAALEARQRRAAPGAKAFRTDAGDLIAAVRRLDGNEAEHELGELGEDIKRIWRGFFGKEPAPSETNSPSEGPDA